MRIQKAEKGWERGHQNQLRETKVFWALGRSAGKHGDGRLKKKKKVWEPLDHMTILFHFPRDR